MAERVLDGARRRELRDGIRFPDRLGRGRIGRRYHRHGRLMVVGRRRGRRARRLPRGGRRDGIFRLGTRPGRRGGDVGAAADPAFVWSSTPAPGRTGMRRDRRPEPPAPASPGVASAAAATGRRLDGPFHHDDPTVGPKGRVRGPGKTRPSTPPTARATSCPAARRGDPARGPSCVRESRAESARDRPLRSPQVPQVSAFFPRACDAHGGETF